MSLRDLPSWRAAGLDLSVAVNLSVSNLQDVALPEQVEMLLDAFGVPAAALTLEITEDVLMADAARSQQVMAGLRRLGVRLSIDDYGTGYSSLSYLRALPGRRAQARPQLRQLPDHRRAGRGDRAQHPAAQPRPRHEHGRRGRGGRRHAGRPARVGLRHRAGLPHRPADGRPSRFLEWLAGRPVGAASAQALVPRPRRPLARRVS